MKYFYLFLTILFVSAQLIFSAPYVVPASDTLIEYSGRIDFTDPDAPRFSYSGVSIRACFKGTAISAILNDLNGENYYNVILDKTLIQRIQPSSGENTYVLAENLADTIHEIEIFKLTEEMFGKTSFLGFQLDEEDSLLEITNPRELLIEFIGNSITCGYGNEGRNGGTFGASTENHYMTYAAITSRSFGARHLAVCKSGIGIYRNYDGPAAGSTDCMTNYYNRVYLYDELPHYSFTETPDLVCINLGTNDFSTGGGDSALYVGTYLNFIDSIQSHYSNPDIVCLIGCMLTGATLEKVREYVQFVADSANNRGKGNVSFFEMSEQTGDLGIGIDYHPTVAQHMENSRELMSYISQLKGWTINPMALKGVVYSTTAIKLQFNTGISDPTGTYDGFTLKVDDVPIVIDSIYKDPSDSFAIHLVLAEEIGIGVIPVLSYKNGQIVGTGDIPLASFSALYLNNILTQTTLNSGKVNSDGHSVSLSFNKTMQNPESIDGLIIERISGNIVIDSFTVSTSTLKLFTSEYLYKSDTVTASYNGIGLIAGDGIPADPFSEFVLTNQSGLSAIENQQINNEFFRCFPNPVYDGRIQYRINRYDYSDNGILSVIDMKGVILLSQNITAPEGELDLKGTIVKGNLYIIQLNLNGKKTSHIIQY